MAHVRVIPTLLLTERGIVKTVGFDDPTYIGCAINAVRVFNANDVDELILLDIEATGEGRTPDVERVTEICDESLMPVAVGGGLRDVEAVREHVGVWRRQGGTEHRGTGSARAGR